MLGNGEALNRIIRPEFNRSIRIDFLGAKITSDAGFLVVREIDERFKVTAPLGDDVDDPRSPVHIRHSMVEMIRQRGVPDGGRVRGLYRCRSIAD